METRSIKRNAKSRLAGRKDQAITGVVASGNLEALLRLDAPRPWQRQVIVSAPGRHRLDRSASAAMPPRSHGIGGRASRSIAGEITKRARAAPPKAP